MQRSSEWRAGLPVLTSPRVVLRELQARDAASLLSMLARPAVEEFLSLGPQTLEEFQQFIVWTQQERQAGRRVSFGLVPSGQETAVGLFQLSKLERDFQLTEWGFALGPRFWGTGLFLESARLVVDFAFNNLGIHRLEARAACDNARGNAALRKLGAVPEGILRKCCECDGEYRDHVMWSILAEDWQRIDAGRETVKRQHVDTRTAARELGSSFVLGAAASPRGSGTRGVPRVDLEGSGRRTSVDEGSTSSAEKRRAAQADQRFRRPAHTR